MSTLHKSPPAASVNSPSLHDVMSAADADRPLPLAYDGLVAGGDCVLDAAAGLLEASRQHELFAKPLVQRCTDAPVIAIGSGPSLDEAIPRLRELQDSCYLIAAHSALLPLEAAGIRPHAWAPVERIPAYVSGGNCIDRVHPDLAYAGLPVVPDAARFCGQHWLATNVDPLYQWLGCSIADIAATSGTGVHTAFVGAQLTSAPVYLVGHDIVAGHCAGYRWGETEPDTEAIDCVDGDQRLAKPLYVRMRRELSWLCKQHRVVQTGRRVATIPGATYGALPQPGKRPRMMRVSGSTERHAYALARFRSVPAIMAKACARMQSATTCAAMSSEHLAGADAELWASLFGNLYGGMSCLRRTLRLSEAETVEHTRIAIRNAVDGLTRLIEEVAHVA